jgi:hypothetical protein
MIRHVTLVVTRRHGDQRTAPDTVQCRVTWNLTGLERGARCMCTCVSVQTAIRLHSEKTWSGSRRYEKIGRGSATGKWNAQRTDLLDSRRDCFLWICGTTRSDSVMESSRSHLQVQIGRLVDVSYFVIGSTLIMRTKHFLAKPEIEIKCSRHIVSSYHGNSRDEH